MRKFAFFVALATGGALFGIAPGAAQTSPNTGPFCQTALKVDKLSSQLFSSNKKPSQKDVQTLDAAFTEAENTAPPEVAANVQAAVSEVRNALQSGKEPNEDVIEPNTAAIDQYRYNSCGYPTAEVTGTEYAFQGLPKTAQTGPLAIKFTDNGSEVHELGLARVKSKDSVKKLVSLPEKEANKKVEFLNGTNDVSAGQTTYLIADFEKPGRYAVVCFVNVGATTPDQAHSGHGTPHAQKGMYGEITVKRGSTATSAP
jgi:uncharacterized cupredoxin-like copper-binding protein